MEQYCLSVIIEMLNPNNTLSFNRLLAHGIGLVESIVYAILIAKQSYYNANGMLYEGGWFYSTVPDLQESTTLGEKAQRTAIAHLVAHGLIECEKKGLPAKRFFRIVNDTEKLSAILEDGKRIAESFRKVGGGCMDGKKSADNEIRKLPDTTDHCVEKMLENKQAVSEKRVDSSYRPTAVSSDRPAQDKSKDNINQNKKIDDRSINRSARENF